MSAEKNYLAKVGLLCNFLLNRTRLYRDGAELQPLMNDEAYDFNFQETRMLKQERQVYLVSNVIK